MSPTTFAAGDADRTHRWAVRLTEVTDSEDPSGRLFDDPPVDAAVDVTEIAWDAADALPFPLCLSVAERPGLEVSVALGNVVLADHGPHRRRRGAGRGAASHAAARCRWRPATAATSPSRSWCRRASAPRWPAAPVARLRHRRAAGRADRRPTRPGGRPARCSSIDPRAATPLIGPMTGTLGAVDRALDAAARPAVERGRCHGVRRRDRERRPRATALRRRRPRQAPRSGHRFRRDLPHRQRRRRQCRRRGDRPCREHRRRRLHRRAQSAGGGRRRRSRGHRGRRAATRRRRSAPRSAR